jgi:hypothetical protein
LEGWGNSRYTTGAMILAAKSGPVSPESGLTIKERGLAVNEDFDRGEGHRNGGGDSLLTGIFLVIMKA